MSTDERPVLRCATCGSVDDGKSTLIGRLLFDAEALLVDQIAHVEDVSRKRGAVRADLSLVTDGLRAEREQGITIDVAWRYVTTPRRRFVLADSPGHVQYTRNMVTAASTADAAVILLDARKGLLPQTKRHLAVATLLGVSTVFVVVNKMDEVAFSPDVFAEIRDAVAGFVSGLDLARGRLPELRYFPVSALNGDNVVFPSSKTPWYDGVPLLASLEDTEPDGLRDDLPLRAFVQWVARAPDTNGGASSRGYAARLASGTLRVGDRVKITSSGRTSTVVGLDTLAGPKALVVAGESAAIRLEDDVDVTRGDLLVDADDTEASAAATREIALDAAWVAEEPLRLGATYVLKQGTKKVRAVIDAIEAVHDTESGKARAPGEGASLAQNELGRIRIRTAEPLVWDRYDDVRATGSAILIGANGDTLAALVRG